MQPKSGVFIVIDSVDAAIQKTQSELLQARLRTEGYNVVSFDFPRSNQPSSYFIDQYLKAGDTLTGPYTSGLFYALDHYQAANDIRTALQNGKIVLATGHVGRILAELSPKFGSTTDLQNFAMWLAGLEFNMLQGPTPTVSLMLHSADQATTHTELYTALAQAIPNQFIASSDDAESIWQIVAPILPEKQPKPTYYVPDSFSEETKARYCNIIDQILELRAGIQAKLTEHLTDTTDAYTKVEEISRLLLPIAATSERLAQDEAQSMLAGTINKHLPGQYSQDLSNVRITNKSPANEITLVTDIVYPHASLSYNEVREAIEEWSYKRKLQVFEDYASTSSVQLAPILANAHYDWDVVTDYATFSDLAERELITSLVRQALTPRYGYEMPQIIEDADVVDDFETCFDLSLQLHSYIQQAGHEHESQYATLQGHKLRCHFSCTAGQLSQLSQTASPLTDQMLEKLAEVHPLIADAIRLNKGVQIS